MATGRNFRQCRLTKVIMSAERHRLWKQASSSDLNMVLLSLFALFSVASAVLSWEWFREINSSLITSTWRRFHYHSFLMSRGLVQFAIISKQHKYVNSSENMHTRKKKKIKKIRSICFHSAVFLFFLTPLQCKKWKYEEKNTNNKKKKTINRLPLLYISVFKYIHIYTVLWWVSTWARSS